MCTNGQVQANSCSEKLFFSFLLTFYIYTCVSSARANGYYLANDVCMSKERKNNNIKYERNLTPLYTSTLVSCYYGKRAPKI